MAGFSSRADTADTLLETGSYDHLEEGEEEGINEERPSCVPGGNCVEIFEGDLECLPDEYITYDVSCSRVEN